MSLRSFHFKAFFSKILQIKVCELEDNHPKDTYFYEVSVQTGSTSTTAEVFLTIKGTESESTPRQLKNPSRLCFQRNDTEIFILSTPSTLGDVTEIEIWHNNIGASPGWFLNQVQVILQAYNLEIAVFFQRK